MLIREYHESDLHRLRAIHAAQGFDYALPDLSNPLFVTKLVLSDANVAAGGNCPAVAASPPPSRPPPPHHNPPQKKKKTPPHGAPPHPPHLPPRARALHPAAHA